ncbi:MAG: sugar ABC transporter substrate-binding protein [Oscillospiraceae bacterium]|nr:sugar ABC transporter substrate-binding protein [Oscillospiraceae bacterium]
MKKNMLAMVGLGLAAALFVGAWTVSAEEAVNVGICLPARDQYWTTFETNLGADLEAEGYSFQTVVAGDQGEEVSTQISQVQTFNNNGFDAVVIGMATGGSGADFMQNVGDMKTVFFNRAVEDGVTDGTQSVYIGMAEYDAGYAQGEWLANYFNEQGKTEVKGMMFMGVLGQDSVTNRTQGAKDALEAGGITVDWVFEQTGEWDRTKAMNLFTQFAGTGDEFDFVCSNNDEMALGVVEACSAMNMEINFPIVGVDATEVGCNAVKAGTMAMTVNQDPKGQAEVVVKAIKSLLAGEAPEGMEEGKIATAAVAITPDNVDDVLANFQ